MYHLLLKIFLVLLVLNLASALRKELADLRKFLVTNKTRKWLDSLEYNSESNSDYCKICCVNITANTVGKTCGTHTMCRYKEDAVGPSCKGYVMVKFTEEEQMAITELHNSLRTKVANGLEIRGKGGGPQPSAANMRMMLWSPELAAFAERWAAQCIFSHDECRDTADFPVGQNLGRASLAMSNELMVTLSWYDEVTKFSHEEVESFDMPSEGTHPAEHYTQMVWADSYQLGCARAIFQHFEDDHIAYKEHFICNYGPSGNIPKQPVYKIGKPCTACPEKTTCSATFSYNGLCELQKEMVGKMALLSGSNVERKSHMLLFINVLNVCLCLYLFS